MSYWHDPEVPAGYQDADIEMANMERHAREVQRCSHSHWGYCSPETGNEPCKRSEAEYVVCYDCNGTIAYLNRVKGKWIDMDTQEEADWLR